MKNADGFISLVRFVLTGTKPDIAECDYHWEVLLQLSSSHKLAAMVYDAARQLKLHMPEQVEKQLQEEYYKALSREIIFQDQYERLEADFIKEGIQFIPLKGIILKEYYPCDWMRTRSDMDILIRDEDALRVKERMKGLGYSVIDYEKHNHDVYDMEPVVSVEAHRSLFIEKLQCWHQFFEEVEDKTRKQQKDSGVQYFSKEDHYLYILAHMANHVMRGGTGVRSVLDAWLFWRKESGCMDLDYIDQSLNKLNLNVFHAQIQKLGNQWMEMETPSQDTAIMEEMILNSGTYGRLIYQQINGVVGGLDVQGKKSNIFHAKLQVLWPLLFPKYKDLRQGYPFLEKYPFLVPAIQIYRCTKFIFLPAKRKKVTRLVKTEDEEIQQYQNFLKAIGLEKAPRP